MDRLPKTGSSALELPAVVLEIICRCCGSILTGWFRKDRRGDALTKTPPSTQVITNNRPTRILWDLYASRSVVVFKEESEERKLRITLYLVVSVFQTLVEYQVPGKSRMSIGKK